MLNILFSGAVVALGRNSNSQTFYLFFDHGDFTGDYGLVKKSQNTMVDLLLNRQSE
jgi:hypothetical protein